MFDMNDREIDNSMRANGQPLEHDETDETAKRARALKAENAKRTKRAMELSK